MAGPNPMGETARRALANATQATKRYGWISFWVQLTLSVVSAVILLFSVAFTSQVRGGRTGPRVPVCTKGSFRTLGGACVPCADPACAFGWLLW